MVIVNLIDKVVGQSNPVTKIVQRKPIAEQQTIVNILHRMELAFYIWLVGGWSFKSQQHLRSYQDFRVCIHLVGILVGA